MKKLRNKKVTKMTVGDLKKSLKPISDDKEVVLGFYMKEKGVHFVYLADVLANMGYDSVIKSKSSVVELCGFDNDYADYMEREDES